MASNPRIHTSRDGDGGGVVDGASVDTGAVALKDGDRDERMAEGVNNVFSVYPLPGQGLWHRINHRNVYLATFSDETKNPIT